MQRIQNNQKCSFYFYQFNNIIKTNDDVDDKTLKILKKYIK